MGQQLAPWATAVGILGAAVVTAVSAFVASLVAWAMNRHLREVTKTHDSELAEVRSRLTRAETAEAHAARRNSELELKLFTLACQSISETVQAFANAEQACRTHEKTGAESDGDAALKASVDLGAVGHFLPPELNETYLWARMAIRRWVRAIGNRNEPEGDDELEEAAEAAIAMCAHLQREAAHWKRDLWDRFVPGAKELRFKREEEAKFDWSKVSKEPPKGEELNNDA